MQRRHALLLRLCLLCGLLSLLLGVAVTPGYARVRPPAHATDLQQSAIQRPPSRQSDLLNPAIYPSQTVAEIKGLHPDAVGAFAFANTSEIIGAEPGRVALVFWWPTWNVLRNWNNCGVDCYGPTGANFSAYSHPNPALNALLDDVKKIDALVKQYSDAGILVTALLHGTPGDPALMLDSAHCTAVPPVQGSIAWCAPQPQRFAAFAGFLAKRYNGAKGFGRIVDFTVLNEVNTNVWFDYGCGEGGDVAAALSQSPVPQQLSPKPSSQVVPCDASTWIQQYANIYNATYDAIRQHQAQARVMVTLTQHFWPVWDFDGAGWSQYYAPAAQQSSPILSVQTFLNGRANAYTGFAQRVGGRQWVVALHPYPIMAPPYYTLGFETNDYPYVTFGNIGVAQAWLRQTFPGSLAASELYLTEQGLSSHVGRNQPDFFAQYWGVSTQQAAAQLQTMSTAQIQALVEDYQSTLLCQAFINVVGTPGINSFLYHRMVDHNGAGGEEDLQLGLRRQDAQRSAKPAWSTWVFANGAQNQAPRCGFEFGAKIALHRWSDQSTGRHWVSTRVPPRTFGANRTLRTNYGGAPEASWRVWRDQRPGTLALYSCLVGDHNLLTPDVSCEGGTLLNLGPVGYVYSPTLPQPQGTVPLYRCFVPANGDHFVSPSNTCEKTAALNIVTEGLLGFVLP